VGASLRVVDRSHRFDLARQTRRGPQHLWCELGSPSQSCQGVGRRHQGIGRGGGVRRRSHYRRLFSKALRRDEAIPGRWGARLAICCPQWEPVSSSPPRVCSGELSANVVAAVISAASICDRVASCPQRVDGFHLRGHDEYKREGSYFGGSRQSAQAHGYGGLNLSDLASEVGIKAASIYRHFPSKADLAAAIAERYWRTQRPGWKKLRATKAIRPKACASIPTRSGCRSKTEIAFASEAS